ncbi:hypothetical protein H5410_057639, partial [Solanum commersonii]
SNLHNQRCLGVFEIVSTQPSLPLPNFESVGLYIPNPINVLLGLLEPLDDERLGNIKVGDAKTFLNMLLYTMKEQLSSFIVASGNELGQRMIGEVVKSYPE